MQICFRFLFIEVQNEIIYANDTHAKCEHICVENKNVAFPNYIKFFLPAESPQKNIYDCPLGLYLLN